MESYVGIFVFTVVHAGRVDVVCRGTLGVHESPNTVRGGFGCSTFNRFPWVQPILCILSGRCVGAWSEKYTQGDITVGIYFERFDKLEDNGCKKDKGSHVSSRGRKHQGKRDCWAWSDTNNCRLVDAKTTMCWWTTYANQWGKRWRPETAVRNSSNMRREELRCERPGNDHSLHDGNNPVIRS